MKDFMLIGPIVACHYGEIFPLIKEGKIWIPPERPLSPTTGKEYGKFTNHFWFETNDGLIDEGSCWYFSILQVKKHHIELTKSYTPEEYPLLDNYEAISVKKVPDIPKDYPGTMAVPTTFLFAYNPDEFEIIENTGKARLNGKVLYQRVLIKRTK